MLVPIIRKFLVFCLVFAPQIQYSTEKIQTCDESQTPIAPIVQPILYKHFHIGSVFALHDAKNSLSECGHVLQRGLQLSEAFLWYLKNRRKIKEIVSGGVVFDSCSDRNLATQKVVSFETEQSFCKANGKVIAQNTTYIYVGGDRLPDTEALASALSRTQKSLISPIGNTMLPDKYTYFFQGAPRYSNSSKVLVNLLNANNIDFVIVLYQDKQFWIDRSKDFLNQANAKKICSVYNATIPPDKNNYNEIFQQLLTKRKTAYVVIIADDEVISSILMAANKNPTQLNSFIFLAIGLTVHNHNFKKIKSVIIIPMVASSEIDSMANKFIVYYKSIGSRTPFPLWIKDYCMQNNMPNCSGVFTEEKLDPTVPFLFLVLRSIMSAIDNLIGTCTYFCSEINNDLLTKLYREISGVKLDVNGAQQAVFDSERFLHSNLVKYKLKITNISNLADYIDGNKLNILETVSECPNTPCLECGEKLPVTTPPPTVSKQSTISYPVTRPAAEKAQAEHQMGYLGSVTVRSPAEFGMRDQNWIIPLIVLAGLGIVVVIVFEIYIMYKLLGTKLGRQWRTMWLGQLLLFGILLCYLTLFAYLPKPTDVTCGITRFGVGFSYAMVFSVMLVKLMVILTSRVSEATYHNDVEPSNYLRGTYQILLFIFALGVQLVIDIQWLITIPPKAVPITDVADGNVWICNHYTWSTAAGPDKSLLFSRTEFENHLFTLVYVMFLILLTTGISMKAHGIVTNHRESIFIGLSAGLSIPIWIAWGLIGGLNLNSPLAYQYGDACIAFGLFLNATLILFAMFLPKVRQMVNMGLEGVYLEDDKDTGYAESVLSYKTYYPSYPGQLMNGGGSVYNGSIKDPMSLHLKHPGSLSSIPGTIRSRPSSVHDNRILKVTPDLTGRSDIDRRRAASEQNYNLSVSGRPRSEKGSTISRSRSTQDLGAL